MWREMIKDDALVRRGAGTILGVVLATAASAWWVVGRVPLEIPLLYSRPWGEGQLVGRQALWWLAGGMAGAGILAVILGMKMAAGQKTAARIIVWTAVLVEVLGFLAVWNVEWRVGV